MHALILRPALLLGTPRGARPSVTAFDGRRRSLVVGCLLLLSAAPAGAANALAPDGDPSTNGAASSPGVQWVAQAGIGALALGVSAGVGFMVGAAIPCDGLFCPLPNMLLVAGLIALWLPPALEYVVGEGLGGRGRGLGLLLGWVAGVAIASGVAYLALGQVAPTDGDHTGVDLALAVIGGAALVLGPAVGYQLSSPDWHVGVAPVNGGGAAVLSGRF